MTKLDKAFITKTIANNLEIEKSTKKHIDKITVDNIKEIHKNLLTALEIKNNKDSKYFDSDIYSDFVVEVKENKKINKEYLEYKKPLKEKNEKPLSKKKWLEEKKKEKENKHNNHRG